MTSPLASALSDSLLSTMPVACSRAAQKEPRHLADKNRCNIHVPAQQEATLPLPSSLLSEQQAEAPKETKEEVVDEETETEVESKDDSMHVECGPCKMVHRDYTASKGQHTTRLMY